MALSLVDSFQSENKIDVHSVDALIERMVSHDTGLDSDQQKALQTLALFQPLPYSQGSHPAYLAIIRNSIFFPIGSNDISYRKTLVNTTIDKCNNESTLKSGFV